MQENGYCYMDKMCIRDRRVGVAGVAVPTLISRMVAAVIMLVIIRNEKNQVHVDKHLRLGYEPDMIRQILRIGIPSGMESSMFQLGKIMVQSLVSSLGTVAIAGFAVATNLASIEYLPGQAIGLGLVTVASQCVGAKEFGQVKEYTKKLVLLDYSILIGIIVVIDLLHKPIIGIYNLSPEAAAIAAGLIVFHGFAMLFWPPAFIAVSYTHLNAIITQQEKEIQQMEQENGGHAH